jgi:hypothetical protein
MRTLDKIESFLEDETIEMDEYNGLAEDDDIVDAMLGILFSLEEEQISDAQAYMIMEVVDGLDPDYDEENDAEEQLDEDALMEVFKKRVRRDLATARKRRREHLRKRAKRRVAGRRYRRSAKGKKTARKAKRFSKFGRTSTMKRQRKFVGPKLKRLK